MSPKRKDVISMEKKRARYMLIGKAKEYKTETGNLIKVDFVVTGRKVRRNIYTARIYKTPNELGKYTGEVVIRGSDLAVYKTDGIEVYNKSSLMRCISIATKIVGDNMEKEEATKAE